MNQIFRVVKLTFFGAQKHIEHIEKKPPKIVIVYLRLRFTTIRLINRRANVSILVLKIWEDFK